MGVFIKLWHSIKVFHGEDIAELVIEHVSLGVTSTVCEPVLPERVYTCCVTPLAVDQTPKLFVVSSAMMSFINFVFICLF